MADTPILRPLVQNSRPALVASVVLITLGIALLPFGAQLHPKLQKGMASLPLEDFWNTVRQFASTTGLIIIVSVIYLLESGARRRLLLVSFALAMGTAALINEPVKRIAGRGRPEWTVNLNASRARTLQKRVDDAGVQTAVRVSPGEGQWIFGKPNRPWVWDQFSSFPSGHSCAAAALAAFLCAAYPRGRRLWILLAIGCALSRVRHDRHFLEDCLVGGGIGWGVAHWVLGPRSWSEQLLQWSKRVSVPNSSFS